MNFKQMTALVLLMALLGACSTGATRASAQTPARQLSELTNRVSSLQSELNLAEKRLARLNEQYKAGQISVGDVEEAQGRAESIKRELQHALKEREGAAT